MKMGLMEIITGLLILIIIIIAYYKWTFKYWSRRNLNCIEPSIPFGCSELNPFTRKLNIGFVCKKQYEEFRKRGWKHGGAYMITEPVYIPADLDILKNIMIRDFEHFTDRGLYHNETDDPVSTNLLTLDGARWKYLRTKLTPTYTANKMKIMFSNFIKCGNQLKEAMDKYCFLKEPVDIKDVLECFTTDIIGSSAFGIECNSFKDPNGEFRTYGKKIFDQSVLFSNLIIFASGFPNLARRLHFVLFPKHFTAFFSEIVKNTVAHREQNKVVRQDFLQLLIDINAKDQTGSKLTLNELAAQVFVFFAGGFETSSTTMTFCLLELSRNPDIQQKLRTEINEIFLKYDRQISYESLQEMKYMQQVIKETLRKYPPFPVTIRRCTKNYTIPTTNVVVEKGTMVAVSIHGIHYDPEYYPEPEKFDPNRFTNKNKLKRHPYAWLPFGAGPRKCIGQRFADMQVATGLAILIRNYRFSIHEKTKLPLQVNPNILPITVVGGLWLNVEKI